MCSDSSFGSGSVSNQLPQRKSDGVRGGPSSTSVRGYVSGRMFSVVSTAVRTVYSSMIFSNVFPMYFLSRLFNY